MDSIKLIYTDSADAQQVITMNVIAVRGLDDPDSVLFFPPLLYDFMDGSKKTAFVGFRRKIMLDFGVVADKAKHTSILAFLQSNTRYLYYQSPIMGVQRSGTLVVGRSYILATYVTNDDFTNVATVKSGAINTANCVFLCTGTTPTHWTHSSNVYEVVPVVPDNDEFDSVWIGDSSIGKQFILNLNEAAIHSSWVDPTIN